MPKPRTPRELTSPTAVWELSPATARARQSPTPSAFWPYMFTAGPSPLTSPHPAQREHAAGLPPLAAFVDPGRGKARGICYLAEDGGQGARALPSPRPARLVTPKRRTVCGLCEDLIFITKLPPPCVSCRPNKHVAFTQNSHYV